MELLFPRLDKKANIISTAGVGEEDDVQTRYPNASKFRSALAVLCFRIFHSRAWIMTNWPVFTESPSVLIQAWSYQEHYASFFGIPGRGLESPSPQPMLLKLKLQTRHSLSFVHSDSFTLCFTQELSLFPFPC
jgi:hypothetical protein